jgi:hypothetical protein
VDRWVAHLARLASTGAAVAERAAAAAAQAGTLPAASPVSFIIIRPTPQPTDVSAPRWDALLRAAVRVRRITVWSGDPHSRPCLLPRLRLRGYRGRRAPGPPPCELQAYRLDVRV